MYRTEALAALFWLSLLPWVSPCSAQQKPMSMLGVPAGAPQAAAGCSAGTFGVDPNAGAVATPVSGAGSAPITLHISTTSCPDEIIVGVEMNTGGTISSPTSPHLTFIQRGSTANDTAEYVATASVALSSEAINIAGTVTFISAIAIAETGIHAAAPFDGSAFSGSICDWTTSNANDLLTAVGGVQSTDTPAAGWTSMGSASFLAGSQKVVSATQSGTSADTAFTSGNNGTICDALIKGP